MKKTSKQFKRVLSLLLAVVMLAGLGVSSGAADDNVSVRLYADYPSADSGYEGRTDCVAISGFMLFETKSFTNVDNLDVPRYDQFAAEVDLTDEGHIFFNDVVYHGFPIIGIAKAKEESIAGMAENGYVPWSQESTDNVLTTYRDVQTGTEEVDGKQVPVIETLPFYGTVDAASRIETLRLPSTLKYIEEGALDGLTRLKDIYYDGTCEEWSALDIDSRIADAIAAWRDATDEERERGSKDGVVLIHLHTNDHVWDHELEEHEECFVVDDDGNYVRDENGKIQVKEGFECEGPSCEEAGKHISKCTVCGEVYEEEVPATGHKMVHSEKEVAEDEDGDGNPDYTYVDCDQCVEATCIADGYHLYICEYCGKEEQEVVEASEYYHHYGDLISFDDEYDGFICELCGDEVRFPHTYDVTVIKKETCTEPGEYLYHCIDCGHDMTVIVPATGHAFTDWSSNNDRTFFQDGTLSRTCVFCGETETMPDEGSNIIYQITRWIAGVFAFSASVLWEPFRMIIDLFVNLD